jgi:hypothetical protein
MRWRFYLRYREHERSIANTPIILPLLNTSLKKSPFKTKIQSQIPKSNQRNSKYLKYTENLPKREDSTLLEGPEIQGSHDMHLGSF